MNDQVIAGFKAALDSFDKPAVDRFCLGFKRDIYQSGLVLEAPFTEKIMKLLRGKRQFYWMILIGDALLQTGRGTFLIRRQYAQALIDQNAVTAAIAILHDLAEDTDPSHSKGDPAEYLEAKGLLGRCYKQLYISADAPGILHNQEMLKESFGHYYAGYQLQRGVNTWHGINAVAVLFRAERDGYPLVDVPDKEELAREILRAIERKSRGRTANAWDYATAAEASLALGDHQGALDWLSGYARMPESDAFELGSTLRQMEEVWQLTLASEEGKSLLPLLKGELLKRTGGELRLGTEELRDMLENNNKIESIYQRALKTVSTGGLEKVFGQDSYKTYHWFVKGLRRCHAVARIGRNEEQGIGTGFLMRGSDLHSSFGQDLVLLTNAHVISKVFSETAIAPAEAVVVLQVMAPKETFRTVDVIWSSPSNSLDASIVTFTGNDRLRLAEHAAQIELYKPVTYLPVLGSSPQNIYIIGHPAGGIMQLSFQDNLLLDHEDPKIHYRTPTDGGSSGSPVFNQQWELIGLHHAGRTDMPCLNKKPGTYSANEGIWIEAIRRKLMAEIK
jgi:hypothetical protein